MAATDDDAAAPSAAGEVQPVETRALFDTLVEHAPIGFAFIGQDLRYRYVNSALAAINGIAAAEHIGRTLLDVVPGVGDEGTRLLRRVLEEGKPLVGMELAGATAAASDAPRVWRSSWYPVRATDGAVIGVGVVVDDITEARQAEEERERLLGAERSARADADEAHAKIAFLAEAGETLAGSLNYERTLTKVTRLAVPRLADWCSIDLLDEAGELASLAVAHVDPDKVELARRLRTRWPAARDAPQGATAVARTGKAELYPLITDEMLVLGATDEEHLAALREVGMRSAMVVPLVARGRSLGALTLIAAESGQEYGADDLDFAHQIARRAAVAMDNARLFQERSHVARTLQASLLPPGLPEIAGVEVAARYRAAGEGNDIGGDFYDLFELVDGAWAVVIGDVCGKWADAAALTGLARHSVRAAAVRETEPARVLNLVNEIIYPQVPEGKFCTLAYARLVSGLSAARLVIANGGHVDPLVLRANGEVESVRTEGIVLGCFPSVELTEAEVALEPGDALVLYTDGVTEARRAGRVLGEAGLINLLREQVGSDAATLAATIEEHVVNYSEPGPPRDDLAVLVVRFSP